MMPICRCLSFKMQPVHRFNKKFQSKYFLTDGPNKFSKNDILKKYSIEKSLALISTQNLSMIVLDIFFKNHFFLEIKIFKTAINHWQCRIL